MANMESSSSSNDQISDIASMEWNDEQTAKDAQAGKKKPDADVEMASAMQFGQPKKETIAPATGASVPQLVQPKIKRPDVWQSFGQIPQAVEPHVTGPLASAGVILNEQLGVPNKESEVETDIHRDEIIEMRGENPVHNIPKEY